MKNKVILIVGLMVLLVVTLYGYEMVFKKPLVESPTNNEETEPLRSSIDIKEQYENGIYTFAGTIQTPTPCGAVDATVTSPSDNVYNINIEATAPSVDIVCAQVITNKNYKVSFEASEDAEIKAFLNGVEYELNRFEVPVGQDIDSFELFIKA